MIGIYILLAILISGALVLNRKTSVNYALLIIFLILQCGLAVFECFHKNEIQLTYFKPDALGLLLLVVCCIISIPTIIHSYIYISTHTVTPRIRGIFFAAMVLLLTAVGVAYLSNHIAVTWILVEITTLSASALIYHQRTKDSLEATWKYVFICAISVTFIFIGVLFMSMALRQAGSSDLTFDTLYSKSAKLNLFWLKLAFLFIFSGFTAKLGLVPMYTAGIDAKDNAPGPAGALFASVLVNIGFIGIYRVYVIIAQTSLHSWANTVIWIAAVLSIFIATTYMMRARSMKRLFAYSGIEHMGLVMLGLAAGGVGYYAAILHIVLHSFVKPSLFFQINQVHRIFHSKYIHDIGNYFKYNAAGAMVLLLGFFCATGMPPSGLFISEFLIFKAMFEAHHIIILILVLILLTVIIWAFGKAIFKIVFIPLENFDESKVEKIGKLESLSQFILLGLSIYIGINPPMFLVNLIQEAISVLPK